MFLELLDMLKYPLHQLCGSSRIVQGYVVRDGIKVGYGWLGPNYFSHLAIFAFACLLDRVRPSSMALSPRAMPSSNLILDWSFS